MTGEQQSNDLLYMPPRRKSRAVSVGRITVGGGAPISVQSMTNTRTSDREETLRQVRQLEEAGCDIVRITVPSPEDAVIFDYLHSAGIRVPLVADIHFDYRAAIESAAAGADKLRINPGNIGSPDRVKAVADACRKAGIPIRVGVNGGSLKKEILEKYGRPCPEALAESALDEVRALERFDFEDVVVAVKSSSPAAVVAANRILSEKCSCPLHIGVTEAGGEKYGVLRSAAGIGALLLDGIGDTIRVSLTADPVKEVAAGRTLLDSLSLSPRPRVRVVSCPTCGRTRVGLIPLVEEFEKIAETLTPPRNITVALMGCVVNGPGEAREADLGVACGDGEALLIRKGEKIGKIAEDRIIPTLLEMIGEIS